MKAGWQCVFLHRLRLHLPENQHMFLAFFSGPGWCLVSPRLKAGLQCAGTLGENILYESRNKEEGSSSNPAATETLKKFSHSSHIVLSLFFLLDTTYVFKK